MNKYKSLTEFQRKLYLKSFAVVSVFLLTMVLLFAITAAWYSNIVEVEELTVEVDSWGVDSTILLDDETILKIAPGDSGVIPFKIDNNADRMVNVQFNAYKKFLPDFMQQRLYFYLEESAEVNGETLDRMYLHDDNAYYYPLIGSQIVDNSGEAHSDVELKWEWVYDLLGYYTIVQKDADGYCSETAYIRPVQYTYENATYNFETGELATLKISEDTVITGAEFILNMLETDGFQMGKHTAEGFVPKEFKKPQTEVVVLDEQGNEKDKELALNEENLEELKAVLKFKDIAGDDIERTYYEIYVDETAGYGIYLYMCDYNEIVVNNKIDTAIGNKEQAYEISGEHFAAVQLSCGQAIEYYIDITDPAQLEEILANNEKYTELLIANDLLEEKDTVILRLGADMAINPVQLDTDGCKVVIDLNGYTLTNRVEISTLFTLNPGCSMRIYNGIIRPMGGVPFLSTGATVVLRDVTIDTIGSAVTINTNGWHKGSNIQLINCSWAEGRPEEVAKIIEIDGDKNVPSFTYIKEFTEVADDAAQQTENATPDAGEVTE